MKKTAARGRVTARGVDRRNQIREAAAALFLSRGYDAVTVDEIAKAAKGSKSAVYENFSDKSGLFSEVVIFILSDIDKQTRDHISPNSEKISDLDSFIDSIYRLYQCDTYSLAYRLSLHPSNADVEPIRIRIESIHDDVIASINLMLCNHGLDSISASALSRLIHDHIALSCLRRPMSSRERVSDNKAVIELVRNLVGNKLP